MSVDACSRLEVPVAELNKLTVLLVVVSVPFVDLMSVVKVAIPVTARVPPTVASLVTISPVPEARPAVTVPLKVGLLMTAIVTVSVAPAVVEMLVPAATVNVSLLEMVCGVPDVPASVNDVDPEPEQAPHRIVVALLNRHSPLIPRGNLVVFVPSKYRISPAVVS